MDIQVKPETGHRATLTYGDQRWPAAIGKAGVTADKKEGDHASPIGRYALRALYFRSDRLDAPDCYLDPITIQKDDGWCDAPDHADYNRKVTLPFDASHEEMWREDNLYDIVVVLGHNDDPPVPGKGSCIFMHVARDGYEGTEGCVALRKEDLIALLNKLQPDTMIEIFPATS